MDKPQAAIDSYRLAINILQKIRYQLVVTDQAPDQSFRDSIGAIYLQFVDLLLQQASKTSDSSQLSLLLKEARDTVEQLKAAELRNYFQDECVDILKAKSQKIETVSSSAMIIYPIILHDRLEILVSHAETGLRRYSVPVDPVRLIDEIRTFRRLLSKQTTYQYRHSARLLYNWLIRPFESDLAEQAIDTLVFVPDGPLRTIPMAALFDGTQHLIEKYAVVTTPGIELTDPRPLESHTIKATIAGLSESIAGFPALTSVQNELTNIHSLYGGNMLINDTFVKTRLKSALQNSNINVLHIATHGQFENKSENSFLLTYDGRLTLNQLSNYIGLFKFRETPLELLVLSACETAQGDDQAALGLSGIAIKSGARSALGTLWRVNDAATSELMTEFYQQLKLAGVSRAAALQKAQLKLQKNIRFRHPVYWSPFLLINSWL